VALWAMREQALKTGKVALPVDLTMNSAGTIARITMPIASTDSRSKTAYDALARLRNEIIPATIGEVPGVEVAVGGETAGNRDFNDLMRTHLPLVFAF